MTVFFCVCLSTPLLYTTHSFSAIHFQSVLLMWFFSTPDKKKSIFLSPFCSLGFSHLHFIPPYLFQVPSPLDMAGNKSLSCNLALLRACNDRDQKMATVEVRWGGLKNLISAQNESLSWSSMLWNTRGNGVSLQRVGLSQKFKHPKGFSNKLYS